MDCTKNVDTYPNFDERTVSSMIQVMKFGLIFMSLSGK